MGWGYYPPYVSAAERSAKALREAQKLDRKGMRTAPVAIAGRAMASTFWGKAWCENLEAYTDFSNRLPRGRTYARNGSILDLQIEPGKVTALVSGSDLYRISICIRPVAAEHWKKIKTHCGGQIGSLVELLQGRLSTGVMEIVTRPAAGLFPTPTEIEMSCSCPDWAGMCKHIAATLYGVGNRLDHQPELLFQLRQVDHLELIAQAGSPVVGPKRTGKKTIAADRLADVFGIEIESTPEPSAVGAPAKRARVPKPTPPRNSALRRGNQTKKRDADEQITTQSSAPVRTAKPKRAALTRPARKRTPR